VNGLIDWLPWSLHCAEANYAAAPVGMTEFGPAYGGGECGACPGLGHWYEDDAGMEIWGGG